MKIETLEKMPIPGQEHKEAADCLYLAAIVCLIMVIVLSFVGCEQTDDSQITQQAICDGPVWFRLKPDPGQTVAVTWYRPDGEKVTWDAMQIIGDCFGPDPNGCICVYWEGQGECSIYQDQNQVAHGNAGEVCLD